MRTVKAGSTSVIVGDLFVLDSTATDGSGRTGLVFNTASLTCYYHRNTANASVAVSLATMTLGTFASGGFKEVDATHMAGTYQFCPPDAAVASGAQEVVFYFQGAANMPPTLLRVALTVQDPQVTNVPTDVQTIKTQTVTCAAGVTINPNVGTTQPINFTGTGGSALAKSDMVDIAGAAVDATAAQLGVNLVTIKAQTITCAASVTVGAYVGNGTHAIVVDASGNASAKLADAVTHGGTTALLRLGSSSSTPAFYVTNSAGDATKFESTAGNGNGLTLTPHGTGYGLSFDVETNVTLVKALRAMLAALAGKLSISGNTVTIRDINDTANRLVAICDSAGQRTSVTPNL